MKKAKNVSLGDKVFAKVKGYPAWPARVDEDLGKKYKVYFYGTGETGLVKAEDLFPYLEHKDQFSKSLKRKDYNDAIHEIESAIADEKRNSLTDDEPSPDFEKEEDTRRSKKRKLSVDSVSSETRKKSTRLSGHKSVKKSESDLSDEENDSEFNEKSNNNKFKTHSDITSEEENDLNMTKEELRSGKFNIVLLKELREIIEEFEQCVQNAEKGNEKPEDDTIPETENEILLARCSEDEFVGVKLNQNRSTKKFETQEERLRWKEAYARAALELKDKVEKGIVNPRDCPEKFEFNLDLTNMQLKYAIHDRIQERHKIHIKFLKTEAHLVQLDSYIKGYLALDKAEPKKALEQLDIMLSLNADPLMLKKHSHIVEMAKRLRRYIGNVKEWKLQGKELEEFKKDAEKIRAKADIVYEKFKGLFVLPEDKTFTEYFIEQCEQFKEMTKDMPENDVFILCVEPGSRQALWNNLDDEQFKQLIQKPKKIKKEISNQAEENSAESAEDATSTDNHE